MDEKGLRATLLEGTAPFTELVESLLAEAASAMPEAERVDAAWTELRRLARRELQRRGLWDSPPSFLGIADSTWVSGQTADARGAPARTRDALDELVLECFGEIFGVRLDSLRRYVARGQKIEAVVARGVQQVIHDRQRKQDRLGFAIFQWQRAAVQQAVERGRLFLVGEEATGEKIGNETVLTFRRQSVAALADRERLEDQVRQWNDELLEAWLSAGGSRVPAVIDQLEEKILGLEQAGVSAFRLGDLVDLLKRDMRVRLAALWDGRDPAQALSLDGELAERGVVEDPLTNVLDHERLALLTSCVEDRIEDLPVQRRTRDQLVKLWRYLGELARSQGEAALSLDDDKLPSHRAFARQLDIRHDRLPALFARLREELQACLETLQHLPAAATIPGETVPPGRGAHLQGREVIVDDGQDLRQELRRRLATSKERPLSSPSPGEPECGDLYLFPACPEPGVEWLVVAVDPSGTSTLVGVDTVSWLGSQDLALEDPELGPVSLRGEVELRLPVAQLSAEAKSGTLSSAGFERALRWWRRRQRGETEPSELAVETDADPDYQDWRRRLHDARDAVLGSVPSASAVAEDHSRPTRVSARRSGLMKWAASIAVAAVSGWLLLAGGRYLERRQVEPRLTSLEADKRRVEGERAALEKQVEALRRSHAEELEASRRRFEAERQAVENRFREELEKADRPEAGAPWLPINKGRERGRPESFPVSEDARSILLMIALDGPGRMEISRRDGTILFASALPRPDSGYGSMVRLPSAMLPPDIYEIKVWQGDELVSQRQVWIERP